MKELTKIKCLLVCLLLVVGIAFDATLRYSIEMDKRAQARYNLEQIQYCVNKVSEVETVSFAFDTCTSEMKTTFTGDVYVLNAATLEFVHEVSNDVPSEPLKFTKESVGKYFKDWESAEKAMYYVLSGKDSVPGLNISYNFDGSPEFLEWKYIPNPHDSLKGNLYVAVQGTQKDEALGEYNTLFWLIRLTTIVMIIILLVEINRCTTCSKRK